VARRSPKKHPRRNAGAHIDDTLVQAHQLRERVRTLVESLEPETLTVEETREIGKRLAAEGPKALRALIDCLFDENEKTHRTALVLLSEIHDPSLLETIREILKRPQLPEKVRVALLAVEALHQDEDEPDEDTGEPPDLSLQSLLQFAESFWEHLEMEEISLLWCENFASEPPDERLAMLEALMSSNNPKLLGIARLEMALGNEKILQFLAHNLRMFDSPKAVRLLEDLLGHPDLVVRTLAEESLAEIKSRRGATAAKPDRPQRRFYRAHLASDNFSGHHSIVYAVKESDGLIKFLVALLDRWDRGVVDCWGNVRYSPEEFKDLLETMAEDFGDLPQKRITKQTALTYLHKAVDLNAHRNHPLPLEFYVWCHLFENERYRPDPAVPEFGADCGVCHKPVRTGPRLPPPWVFGDLVICDNCSKRTFRCPICGSRLSLSECLLVHGESDNEIDLRCPHCFQTLQMIK